MDESMSEASKSVKKEEGGSGRKGRKERVREKTERRRRREENNVSACMSVCVHVFIRIRGYILEL